MSQSPVTVPNRFDYVAYDQQAMDQQALFKKAFMELEALTESTLQPGRYKALLLTALEESYMWVGKSIRDDQITRNGTAPLQEARGKE